MWALFIVSLLTGQIALAEDGFKSKAHCEHRAQSYSYNIDHYVHACIEQVYR